MEDLGGRQRVSVRHLSCFVFEMRDARRYLASHAHVRVCPRWGVFYCTRPEHCTASREALQLEIDRAGFVSDRFCNGEVWKEVLRRFPEVQEWTVTPPAAPLLALDESLVEHVEALIRGQGQRRLKNSTVFRLSPQR